MKKNIISLLLLSINGLFAMNNNTFLSSSEEVFIPYLTDNSEEDFIPYFANLTNKSEEEFIPNLTNHSSEELMLYSPDKNNSLNFDENLNKFLDNKSKETEECKRKRKTLDNNLKPNKKIKKNKKKKEKERHSSSSEDSYHLNNNQSNSYSNNNENNNDDYNLNASTKPRKKIVIKYKKKRCKKNKKKYYLKNKPKITKYQKEYRQNNRPKIVEYQTKYRQNNKPKILDKLKSMLQDEKGRDLSKINLELCSKLHLTKFVKYAKDKINSKELDKEKVASLFNSLIAKILSKKSKYGGSGAKLKVLFNEENKNKNLININYKAQNKDVNTGIIEKGDSFLDIVIKNSIKSEKYFINNGVTVKLRTLIALGATKTNNVQYEGNLTCLEIKKWIKNKINN